MEDKSNDDDDEYEEGNLSGDFVQAVTAVGIRTEFEGISGVDETDIVVQNPGSMDITTEFEPVRTDEIDNMLEPLINSVEDQCDSPVVTVSNTTKWGTPKESVENLAIDENVSSLSQTESRMVLTSVVVQ